jgi:uncharacterized protein DUF3563
MRAMNFQLEAPGSLGAWIARSPKSDAPTKSNGQAQPSLMERFDRWLWKQHVREREAYLADAQDIFDLEDRIRRLERSVGSRYY